jgi:hypothetical protein
MNARDVVEERVPDGGQSRFRRAGFLTLTGQNYRSRRLAAATSSDVSKCHHARYTCAMIRRD